MQLGDAQQTILDITPTVAASGKPGAITPGSVSVVSSDDSVLAVVAGADELHPILRAVGVLGTASAAVTATSSDGATLSATTEAIEVVNEPATGLTLALEAPTEQV